MKHMIFFIQKGDTKVEEQFFSPDDKFIKHLTLSEPIDGLVMILENGRGNILTTTLEHDLTWTSIADFGWIWFRFKPAKKDTQIDVLLEEYQSEVVTNKRMPII